MKLIGKPGELRTGEQKVCLAIGMFDGVHLGHQQVIRQTISDARQNNALAIAITFDQHPSRIVHPEKAPPLIHALNQKLRCIQELGVDAIWLIHFDLQFSQRSGEDFIRGLKRDFGQIYSICVGANFHFGHKRSGNLALLKQLGGELGFITHGLASVSLGGRVVSSTRIRETIQNGDLDSASQMLGRAYSVWGMVEKGDGLGAKLDFPTANVNVEGLALPPNGVYLAQTRVKEKLYPSAVNIGVRPTLQNPAAKKRFETHILDVAIDLYGKEIEVILCRKIRDEMRFGSLEELKSQIAKDVGVARKEIWPERRS